MVELSESEIPHTLKSLGWMCLALLSEAVNECVMKGMWRRGVHSEMYGEQERAAVTPDFVPGT